MMISRKKVDNMNRNAILILSMVLIAAVLSGCVQETSDHEIGKTLRENYGDNVTLVIASEDDLLGKYEKSDIPFRKSMSNRTITYAHHRMIDGIMVDRDHRIYVFDKNTQELIRKNIHWRDDLPEHLPPIIPKEQAESIAGGGSATLYFISKGSHVFPIKPAPKNPCWAVSIAGDAGYSYITDVIIVDAVEGKILGHGVPPPSASEDEPSANRSVVINETLRRIYGDNATLVIASEDELLGKHEVSGRLFEKVERRNKIIYWHQRMIDGAKVEGDRRNYQFNRTTKELIRKDVHWCDDLPEHLPPIIPKEEAESMVGGAIRSELYIISPESHAFPIKPAPKNPCWVVRRIDGNGYINITIVDAVEGKILGYGVPPP